MRKNERKKKGIRKIFWRDNISTRTANIVARYFLSRFGISLFNLERDSFNEKQVIDMIKDEMENGISGIYDTHGCGLSVTREIMAWIGADCNKDKAGELIKVRGDVEKLLRKINELIANCGNA